MMVALREGEWAVELDVAPDAGIVRLHAHVPVSTGPVERNENLYLTTLLWVLIAKVQERQVIWGDAPVNGFVVSADGIGNRIVNGVVVAEFNAEFPSGRYEVRLDAPRFTPTRRAGWRIVSCDSGYQALPHAQRAYVRALVARVAVRTQGEPDVAALLDALFSPAARQTLLVGGAA